MTMGGQQQPDDDDDDGDKVFVPLEPAKVERLWDILLYLILVGRSLWPSGCGVAR